MECDVNELVRAYLGLLDLYNWLSQSPTGEAEDLAALDTALEVLQEQVEAQGGAWLLYGSRS